MGLGASSEACVCKESRARGNPTSYVALPHSKRFDRLKYSHIKVHRMHNLITLPSHIMTYGMARVLHLCPRSSLFASTPYLCSSSSRPSTDVPGRGSRSHGASCRKGVGIVNAYLNHCSRSLFDTTLGIFIFHNL